MMRSSKPVFIIGSYRSGTSVLTWAIGQHPNLLPLEETNWIYQMSIDLLNQYRLGSLNGNHSHLSSLDITKKDFMEFFGESIHSFVSRTKKICMENSRRVLQNNLEPLYLSAQNYVFIRNPNDPKTRWVDGTPENSHYVYGLNLLFPEAKFIHILRNPKKVASSLMKFSTMGQRDYPEEEAYATWRRLAEDSFLAEKGLGAEKVLRITQEGLEREPEETLKQCLSFLGEDYHPDCMLPLGERINSSTYNTEQDYSIETNLDSSLPYVKDAFTLYQEMLNYSDGAQGPDKAAFAEMESKFNQYAHESTRTYWDKTLSQKDVLIESLQRDLIKQRRKLQLSIEPLSILAFGPEDIEAGQPFNIQPDGNSALWIRVKHLSNDCSIVLNGVTLKSYVDLSSDAELITAPIPLDLLDSPGKVDLYVEDTRTGVSTNIVHLKIKGVKN